MQKDRFISAIGIAIRSLALAGEELTMFFFEFLKAQDIFSGFDVAKGII